MKKLACSKRGWARAGRGPDEGWARPGEEWARNGRGRARNGRPGDERKGVRGRGRKTVVFGGYESLSLAK